MARYQILNINGKKYRPLTTNAAERLVKDGGEVYRYENGSLNRLFENNIFAPNDLYYTPVTEEPDHIYGPASEVPLICPNCGHNTFFAHQVCRLDVIVDCTCDFIENARGTADDSIYDAGNPYGPYTCTKCEYEIDID